MIFTMSFNLTWHTSAAKSNLTRLQAGDLAGRIRKITALEKRAGRLETGTAAILA
jgi:hypothetical protein